MRSPKLIVLIATLLAACAALTAVACLPHKTAAGTAVMTSAQPPRQSTASAAPVNPDPQPASLTAYKLGSGYIDVWDVSSKKALHISIEDYVADAVAAEMPCSFPSEALEAQAVACRTFAVYCILHPRHADHGCALCTDSACCMAYTTQNAAVSRWNGQGLDGAACWAKIQAAAAATSGVILLYGGEPADAVFHSMSEYMTESSQDVWGGYLPYLQAVATPESDAWGIPGLVETTKLTPAQFRAALASADPKLSFPRDPAAWLGETQYNASHRLARLGVCGITFTGAQLQSLFALRSTDIALTWDGADFVFTVRGYGHGVGMSQYGAEIMALQGHDYTQILTWYYTGVDFAALDYQGK